MFVSPVQLPVDCPLHGCRTGCSFTPSEEVSLSFSLPDLCLEVTSCLTWDLWLLRQTPSTIPLDWSQMFVRCKSEQIRRCWWTLAALFARLGANMFNVPVHSYLFSCCELHLHRERGREGGRDSRTHVHTRAPYAAGRRWNVLCTGREWPTIWIDQADSLIRMMGYQEHFRPLRVKVITSQIQHSFIWGDFCKGLKRKKCPIYQS